MTTQLPDYTYIEDAEQLRWLAVELSRAPMLALDTESNSMYAYQGEICLVQLSTREKDYIIDALAIDDLSPLGVLMEAPAIEKIFHAAEYDLMLFKRDYGFGIQNLFDTMVAARLAGHTYHGLANMMKSYFDIELNKSHQRDNWGERPLSQGSLRYAQMDTHFLPRLRDALQRELEEMGRWEEALELFEEAQNVPPAEASFDPDGYWKLTARNNFNKTELGILREVYLLREDIARREDVPVHRIIPNKTLIGLVHAKPTTMRQLDRTRGLHPRVIRKHGHAILAAIAQGKKSKPPVQPPAPKPPPQEIADRYLALQQWRKAKGEERGVESDVVLTKDIMWRLAEQFPQTEAGLHQIEGLGVQRIGLYADEILQTLADA
ncbi:MAG: HRDC domain-containing protein [Chloroflexota bacterium]